MYNITQVVINYLFHDNTRQHINTLVIDDGNNLKKLKCILRKSPHYKFVGYLSNNEEADLDPDHLGKIADIREIIDDYSIEHIIFTKNRLTKKHADLLMRVKLEGTKMVDYFTFLERAEGKVDVDKIDSVWVVMTDSFNRTGSILQRKLKRGFDFVLSVILFLVFVPFMIITYVMVKCDIGFKYLFFDPMRIIKNPAFFKQKRIGYLGQEFEIKIGSVV